MLGCVERLTSGDRGDSSDEREMSELDAARDSLGDSSSSSSPFSSSSSEYRPGIKDTVRIECSEWIESLERRDTGIGRKSLVDFF